MEIRELSDPSVVKPIDPKKDGKKMTVYLGISVIIILLLIIAVLLAVILNSKQDSSNTLNNSLDNSQNQQPAQGTPVKPSFTVASPTQGAEVNGLIALHGSASNQISGLDINIKDSTGKVIGQTSVKLQQGNAYGSQEWNASLDVVTPPTGENGVIDIKPSDSAFSDLEQMINVKFKIESDSAGTRIKVAAPLDQQLITDSNVLFKGQAQGFFEGTVNVRLKDLNGSVIYDHPITVANNYGTFADFSDTLSIDKLSQAQGKAGTLEIYETSAKDGSTNVVLSFGVRFQ